MQEESAAYLTDTYLTHIADSRGSRTVTDVTNLCQV